LPKQQNYMRPVAPAAISGSLIQTASPAASTVADATPTISIVMPVLNEEGEIAHTLARLERELNGPRFEVIVVDGGSRDRTRELIRHAAAARLIESAQANRGWQMNEGARHADGAILLFIHADVKLPADALLSIEQALCDEQVAGGCFQICFPLDAPRSLRRVAWGINLRTRLFRTATGDQAIFVRRRVFDEIGGYQALPLMEDIAFFNQIKRRGRVAILAAHVEISPRRWLKHGIWRTVLLMYILRIGHWFGIAPATLKRFFIDVR
jgi:rSAM/selenodomain-associated transferase 2